MDRIAYGGKTKRQLPGAPPVCTAGCNLCMVDAFDFDVALLYWPTSTGTLTGTSTEPTESGVTVVAMYGGRTFTSPTPYLSFTTVMAWNWCSPVGGFYTSALVTIPPAETLTIMGARSWTGRTPRSVNFADFNQPISAEVYRGLGRCGEGGDGCDGMPTLQKRECRCPVAVLNGYTPLVVYPNVIRSLDPE